MSKKTDSIEVRLSPELKARLAQESAASGTTMSGYVRDLIKAGQGSAKPDGVSPMKLAQTTVLTALPAAILAAVVFGGATATATPQLRVEFAEMDLNGDGVITAEEYTELLTGEMVDDGFEDPLPAACAHDPALAEMTDADWDPQEIARADLADMDANGDFKVTYDELVNAAMRSRAEDFLAMDQNGDGVLDTAEIVADFGPAFDLPHGDGAEPGVLSEACLTALEKSSDEIADWGKEGGALDADTLTHEARLVIAEMDANRDGVVSLREFLDM